MNNLNNMNNVPMGQRQQFGMSFQNQLASGTQAAPAAEPNWQAGMDRNFRDKLTSNLYVVFRAR
jgi:hypothetical protein